jgi:hypothetical protein
MAANFDRFSHAVGLLSEVGAVLGVPTTDVAKAMNLLVALSEKHQGAKMADRVKLPKVRFELAGARCAAAGWHATFFFSCHV